MELTKAFYSPTEVAAMASLHPSTIRSYIAAGRLYAVKLSERTYRIPVRAVIRLLDPERLSLSSMIEEPDADVEHALELTFGSLPDLNVPKRAEQGER